MRATFVRSGGGLSWCVGPTCGWQLELLEPLPAACISYPRHIKSRCLAQVKQLREALEAAQGEAAKAGELTAEWRGRAEAFDRDRQAAASNIRWGGWQVAGCIR